MTTATPEPGRKSSIRLITASQYPSTVDVEAAAEKAAAGALARRAPKLKLYGPSTTDAFPPLAVLNAIGAARGRVQAPYSVAATSKAAAARHLEAAGFRVEGKGRHLRVQTLDYITLAALHDGGLLHADGDIVAWTDRGGVENVRGIATVHPGREARLWGNWQLARFEVAGGPVRYMTFALRHNDLARFPERRPDEPPTPASGWTIPAGWTETRA